MRFEVRRLLAPHPGAHPEHMLYAVDPLAGNDSALLAVFDNPRSPAELAAFLNWAYDKYLHEAPMKAATETRITPGGYAQQSAYDRSFGSKLDRSPVMAERSNQSPPAEKSSDPNLAGADETKRVNRLAVERMTPSDEYDQNEPYHKPKGVA